MLTTIVLFLLFLAIGSFIGLFHKRVGRFMKMIRFTLRQQRLNRRNLRRFPRTSRKLGRVLGKERSRHRFIRELFARYEKDKKKTG